MTTRLKAAISEPPAREWLSLQLAALMYCVSVDTLRRQVAAGDLPASRLGRRLIRVRVADLDRIVRPIPNAQWSQPGARSVGATDPRGGVSTACVVRTPGEVRSFGRCPTPEKYQLGLDLSRSLTDTRSKAHPGASARTRLSATQDQ
jgi:Helix-turn-helix domain